ncbi:MAG: DUF86 domain-containing protein [Nanoarchaeota archaeon]|nr:DUF86 domain-containing protein [Nanoarchaeota archaeon]MBU1621987.1 DUF86 domain-containing protein [Nanoarchaeota archaeon]
MKKDPLIFIKHIRDFIEDVENYTKNKTKDKFLKNGMMQDAIFRKIEIIGEATKNLPASFRKKYHSVPWNDIAGMRDKLIHHYFGVDLNKAWNVVKDDLPKLKKEIKKILEAEK